MLLHLWVLIGLHMLSSYATSQTWYNMPRKFMPMKAKQRQKVGGTNSLINTLLVVLHNGVKNIHVRKAWLVMCYPNREFLWARLHETRSELKPVWNLKPLWNVVPFTWQFTWRFHCCKFPNNSKTLIHMWKWYL